MTPTAALTILIALVVLVVTAGAAVSLLAFAVCGALLLRVLRREWGGYD